MDCFASLAMTKAATVSDSILKHRVSRYNFAISRPDMPEVFWKFPLPSNQRARGMPGADAPAAR
jgi:hypothetical protein